MEVQVVGAEPSQHVVAEVGDAAVEVANESQDSV